MIHKECGDVAFLYKGRPVLGDTTRHDLAIGPNGEEIEFGSVMRCFSCGKAIRHVGPYCVLEEEFEIEE